MGAIEVNKRPKVLQINKLYFPHIGGVENTVQDIVEGLKDKVHFEVLACESKGRGKRKVIGGTLIKKASSLGIVWSMPIAPSFPYLLKQAMEKADILHFHLPFPLAVLSYLMVSPLSCKKRIVITWHSDIIRQRAFLRFYAGALRSFLRKSDRIIVTSPIMLENSPFLKHVRDRCRVVPSGISKYWFEKPNDSSPLLKGMPCSNTILFVGRLCYYKGVEYLIDAMEAIDANLVIVGDGALRSALEERAKAKGVDHKTFFVGKCSQEELRRWYHYCDVFVFPSVEPSEALGLVQMEAMAAGKPVVNTNLPTGVPYVSVHGETGFTVSPRNSRELAQAVNRILKDEDLKLKFSINARHRVLELFTVDRMISEIYQIYLELWQGADG